MGQAQINVRTRACSRTSIARTKQAAMTHNVRGKELTHQVIAGASVHSREPKARVAEVYPYFDSNRFINHVA